MNELHRTLNEAITSNSANPALTILIEDYTRYHFIMVVFGGLWVLLLGGLSITFLMKFKRTPKLHPLKWGFEKKVYFYFGILSSCVALFMLFIVVANTTNVLNPVHGFSLLVK